MKAVAILVVFIWACSTLPAQTSSLAPSSAKADDISGMYSFLQDGEFLQLTVDDNGHLTGFISRYGDSDSDRGAFLNQFFKIGSLEGAKLSFTTETVHAVSYEFKGVAERTPGKTPGEEGYRVLRGKLIENRGDADKKVSSKSREVVFKSFPKDLETAPPKN
jgi:hypothetical protein